MLTVKIHGAGQNPVVVAKIESTTESTSIMNKKVIMEPTT
jgi:hypothetical protein